MKDIKPISSLLVGIVTGTIYGGATLFCGPVVLFFLAAGSMARPDSDPIATLAMFAPLASSALGFLSGVLMASMFNFFAKQTGTPKRAVVVPIRPQIREASAGSSVESQARAQGS